jgi:hypothetical protein
MTLISSWGARDHHLEIHGVKLDTVKTNSQYVGEQVQTYLLTLQTFVLFMNIPK